MNRPHTKFSKTMRKNSYKGNPNLNHPKTATNVWRVRELTKIVNGYEYRLIVEGGQTRSCGYERAAILRDGVRVALGVYRWLNRPWQSFDGECATQSALSHLGKVGKDLEDVFLLRAAATEEEAAEKMYSDFKAAHDKLSDRGKAIFANSGIEINSKEDAEHVTALMNLGALMGL